MTARTFEMDDLAPAERKDSGVRVAGERLLTYDMTVVAADVEGVVGAAGGWLCDRVRAGGSGVLGLQRPAALAVDASVLSHDEPLRREVFRAVDGGRAEVTVWGESGLFAADRRFGRVRHRLSAAARAFKARALLSTGVAGPEPAVEEFVSSALWYPPDGADLVPSPARR